MKKTILELLFWAGLLIIFLVVNSQAKDVTGTTSVNWPVSAVKTNSGLYDVYLFGNKSFSETFASVEKVGGSNWQVLKVSNGKIDDYWIIGPEPNKNDDSDTEEFPYYTRGGYDFRESIRPDLSVKEGTTVTISNTGSKKPVFEYNQERFTNK